MVDLEAAFVRLDFEGSGEAGGTGPVADVEEEDCRRCSISNATGRRLGYDEQEINLVRRAWHSRSRHNQTHIHCKEDTALQDVLSTKLRRT